MDVKTFVLEDASAGLRGDVVEKLRRLPVKAGRRDMRFFPAYPTGDVANFEVDGHDFQIYDYGSYKNDKTRLIRIVRDKSLVGTLSVCVPVPGAAEELLKRNLYVLKNWSENEEVFDLLVRLGIVVPTGYGIATGFVVAPVCEIDWIG